MTKVIMGKNPVIIGEFNESKKTKKTRRVRNKLVVEHATLVTKVVKQNSKKKKYSLQIEEKKYPFTRKYYLDNDSQKQGLLIETYEKSDKIRKESCYSDSLLDGIYHVYYPNGQLQQDHTYKEGKLVGVCRDFHKNGIVSKIAHYEDGDLHGAYQEFYFDGKLSLFCYYKDGDKHGPYKSYYENLEPNCSVTYDNGTPIGKSIHYRPEDTPYTFSD
jgi:antitoxin component YwqK of YwqJK toxin-antitoxin module